MTQLVRRGRTFVSKSQRKALLRDKFLRRLGPAEHLEQRSLMAADVDVYAGYWNPAWPTDVNNDKSVDPQDVLTVIYDLNVHGARKLAAPVGAYNVTASGGEGESGSPDAPSAFVDVDRDGYLTPADILWVVHALGGEGEAGDLVELRVVAVPIGTPNTTGESPDSVSGATALHPGRGGETNTTPARTLTQVEAINGVAVIDKGKAFELRFYVQDISDPNSTGVFSAFFDAAYKSANVIPVVNEVQTLTISSDTNSFSGGSFTLTYNGTTVNVNPVFQGGVLNAAQTATRIRDALATIPSLGGVANFTVVNVNSGVTGANPNVWEIRFTGALENTDLAGLTVNPAGLLGSSNIVGTVDQFNGGFKGLATDPNALRRAFFPSPALITDGSGFGTAYLGGNNVSARLDSGVVDVFSEVGTIGQPLGPTTGTTEREFLRVKMIAVDGTGAVPISFELTPADLVASKTLINGKPGLTIDPVNDIEYGDAFQLLVREYVTANADLFSSNTAGVVNLGGGSFQLPVLSNDTALPGVPFALDASTVFTTSLGGTVVIQPGNGSLRYTPAAGFSLAAENDNSANIQIETFTYRIVTTDPNNASNLAYRDTATVSVRIVVPNAPPVNIAPTSITINEGGTAVFSGGNALEVTDADAGAVGLTMTLSVPAGSGRLDLTGGNSAGVAGSGTNSITITSQSPSAFTTLLAGMVYTPPNTDFNGQVLLTINTNDNGSGVGSPAIDIDTVTINITAINDAPIQAIPAGPFQTTDEDVLDIAGLQVADVDSGNGNLTVTLAVRSGSFGTLSLNGANGTTVGGSGTRTLTVTGTQAQLNLALPTLRFTPVLTQTGSMVIDIQTNDNGNTPSPSQSSASQQLNITVIPSARPKAVDDTPATNVNYSFAEKSAGGLLGPRVIANDLVHPGSVAQLDAAALVSGSIQLNYAAALGGAVVVGADTIISQTGDDFTLVGANLPTFFYGTVTFRYMFHETPAQLVEVGEDREGFVLITITNVNDAPVAVADTPVTTDEEVQISIPVTANDTDPDNDAAHNTLTATIVTGPANGTIVSNSAGIVTYLPNLNFNGQDTFTYQAFDGQVTSANVVTVTINVTPVNDAPVATPFSVAKTEGLPVTVDFAGRVTDVEGNPVAITIVSPPSRGALTPINGTSFTYNTTNPDFFGTDTFTYTATDGQSVNGTSALQTVTINISPVNDAPVAQNDTKDTGEGQTVDIAILANDYDIDASPTFVGQLGLLSPGTTIAITTPPTNGTATLVTVGGSQVLRYVPNAFYNGPDSVVYRLNDNDPLAPANQLSAFATVTINVLEKNDPPVAVGESATTNEDTSVTIDVFANDSDPDTANTLWSFVPVTQPAHGTISFNASRQVVYTPNANYFGTDSFTYKVNDQSPIAPINLESNTVTVSLTINEVNDPLVFAPVVPGLIIANGSISYVNSIDILGKVSSGVDTAAQDAPIVITAGSVANGSLKSTAGGTLTITADGKIEYKAPAGMKDFNDSFVVTVTDRNGTGIPVSQTVNFFVQEAVPFNLHLNVFADNSNLGVRDATEVGLAGIGFTITGTDFRGQAVSLPTQYTDGSGRVNLTALLPGTYFVDQIETGLLGDGTAASTDPRVTLLNQAGDRFQVVVGIIPVAGQSPDITINFGEKPGASSSSQAYAQSYVKGALPYAEHIVSTGSQGMLIAGGTAANAGFYSVMGGWANVAGITLTNVVVANDAMSGSANLNVTAVGGGTTTVKIYLHRTPGFEIIGGLSDGSRVFMLNATAAQLGLTQFVPLAGGESFADEADEFFAGLGA